MRRVLITGATSGLGHALAMRLAQTDSVIAVGRNRERLAALSKVKGVAEVIACDLAQPGVAAGLLAQRDVDVLINNAGVLTSTAKFAELPPEAIDSMIDVNFRAAMQLTRAALPAMLKNRRGHIVFVGSTAGHFPFPGSTVYGATKAALSLFVDALRMELLGERIRVTEVAPGRIRTDLYRDALGANADRTLYDDHEPLEPDDVAELVVHCLNAPARVDVSHIEIFPTTQAAGGGRTVRLSEMRERSGQQTG